MVNRISHTSHFTVTNNETAQSMGSGDMPVLATPALVAIMENAAMLAAATKLEDGETTVGGSISVKHLKPSPVGATIIATAILNNRDGHRMDFDITALQDDVVVGTATHTRFVVNRIKFMNKL